MTVEQAVLEQLRADAGVAAIVGARVYQLKLPQAPTFPAVCVQLVDEPARYHLRGEDDLTRARVQVDVFVSETAANPYTAAVDLAAAVDAVLSGQRFISIGSPALEVTGCFRQLRQVLYEAEELRLVRVLQDYWVWSRTVN